MLVRLMTFSLTGAQGVPNNKNEIGLGMGKDGKVCGPYFARHDAGMGWWHSYDVEGWYNQRRC